MGRRGSGSCGQAPSSRAEADGGPSRWGRAVTDVAVVATRLATKDEACASQLKKRTLTNPYNQGPARGAVRPGEQKLTVSSLQFAVIKKEKTH